MTDNTKFKEDGAALLKMLVSFRRKYIHHYPVHSCPAKAFEGILRSMLMLASYCITDPSPGGKNARKHLYESGAWTGDDGSTFGKQLESEFNSTPTT